MRKSWLMLALFGWCSWWTAAWAQDSVVPVQPEIVLVDHHAEAKPAPSACAPSCACRPTFCLPRISLSGLCCRLQPSCPPCPQPCQPSCPKVHAAPCCGHQVRPLFCREPQPCPRPVVHCHVQAPVCHQPCPSSCHPSLLERLHNLLRRDCSAPCSATCAPVTPAPAKSEPEKAPLPKPAK
jgi:hypothetical protein